MTKTTQTKYIMKKQTDRLVLIALIGLGLSAQGAMASQKGYLQVTSKVQKIIVVNHNGKKVPTYVPAKKVLPGEIVQYNTFFQNISTQPAQNINIVNPIPAHTVYLPNSAQGANTRIVFSVDGGKHYGRADTLMIHGKDGKMHRAKPSDYTHIRWQFDGSLSPKERKAVGFKVRLL